MKDVIWFTQLSQPSLIGIVKTEPRHDGLSRFYIGTAIGEDEDSDIRDIMMTGARIEPDMLIHFLTQK